MYSDVLLKLNTGARKEQETHNITCNTGLLTNTDCVKITKLLLKNCEHKWSVSGYFQIKIYSFLVCLENERNDMDSNVAGLFKDIVETSETFMYFSELLYAVLQMYSDILCKTKFFFCAHKLNRRHFWSRKKNKSYITCNTALL